jgi:hypothetical protein
VTITEDDKLGSIRIWSFAKPHMRGLHLGWLAFFMVRHTHTSRHRHFCFNRLCLAPPDPSRTCLPPPLPSHA